MWCFMKIFLFGPLGFSLKLKNVKKWPKIEICHTCKLDEYLEVFFENLPFTKNLCQILPGLSFSLVQ